MHNSILELICYLEDKMDGLNGQINNCYDRMKKACSEGHTKEYEYWEVYCNDFCRKQTDIHIALDVIIDALLENPVE